MAKNTKKLDESSLRAMATLATSSSDLSKLQENFGWNTTETIETPPAATTKEREAAKPALVIETQEPVSEETVASLVDVPVKAVKESISGGVSEKRIEKYANNYLQPIKGFERPTKVAYISKRSHSHITFLQRYAELTGSKVSLQEIMENIFRQHFTEHRAEMDTMRHTVEQKEAQLREW